MRTRSVLSSCIAGLCLVVASAATAQTTAFSTDVSIAIDRGLAWLDANGVYANPSSAGDGAGLSALALLEKRASADQGAPATGYDGASPADQARLDAVMSYIITRALAATF